MHLIKKRLIFPISAIALTSLLTANAAIIDTTGSTVIIQADEPQNTYEGNGTLRISADADSIIELAKSNSILTTEFAMTGGLMTIDSGVTLRNGGFSKGLWTNNKANLEIRGILDVWDGQSISCNALTGSGQMILRTGTSWSGTKSVTVGTLDGSGTYSGSIVQGDSSRNIQIVKTGSGTQIFNNLANQRAPRFVANGGVLEFATTSHLTMTTDVVSTLGSVSGSFTKSGVGTLTISGTFNPNGTTTVSGGALTIFNSLPSSATVVLAANTRIDLNFSEVDTIRNLQIAGSSNLPAGIYNSNHPTYGSYFSGPGSLQVITETAAQSLSSQVLGALTTPHSFNLSIESGDIDYTVNLATQTYDIRLPSNYNPNETYGLISFCNSGGNGGDPPAEWRDILDKYRIIWIAGDGISNAADIRFRRGVTLLGGMRATQRYKIDPARIFASGTSGGSRMATGTAIMRDDFFKGAIGEVGASATEDLPQNFLGGNDDFGYFWTASGDSVTSARAAYMTFYNTANLTIEGDFREREISTIHHLFMTPNGNISKLCKGPGVHETKLDYIFEEATKFVHSPLYPVVKDTFGDSNVTTNPEPGDGFSVTSGSATEGNVTNPIAGNPVSTSAVTLAAGAEIRSNDVFNWNDSYGMSLTSAFRSSFLTSFNHQMELRLIPADLRESAEMKLVIQQISATSKKASFVLVETGTAPVTICAFDFDSADEPMNRLADDRAYYQAGDYTALGYLFRGSDLTWHMDDDKFQFSFRQNVVRNSLTSPFAVKPLLQIDNWSIQGRWSEMGIQNSINRLKKIKQWRVSLKNSPINSAAAANSALVDSISVNAGQQGFLAPQDGSQSMGNLFTQASDSTGILALEAESFNGQETQGLHHWVRTTARSGFSGQGAVVSSNDYRSEFLEPRFADWSSRLEYDVQFTKTGNHRVWIRGHAVSDDSCWISLNENGLNAVEVNGFTPGAFGWASKVINIPSSGRKKISMWIGKDGLAVDQILFSSDLSYTPSAAATPSTLSTVSPLPRFTLNASATNGSITLFPTGGVYESGQEVTIIAEPIAGFAFNGWTGLPANTPRITTVIMDGNRTISASFTGSYTVTTSAVNGTVTLNPTGGNYPANSSVQVTATPSPGYVFSGWTGLTGITVNPATVIVDGNKTITANFVPAYTITASATNGTIITSPAQSSYSQGTAVSITAQPASGYRFNGWVGVPETTSNPANITMNADRIISANFVLDSLLSLSTSATNGSITLSPPGGAYSFGTTVTVTAVANANFIFGNWAGDLSGSTNSTTIVMNGNRSISAVFQTRDAQTQPGSRTWTVPTNVNQVTVHLWGAGGAGGSGSSGTATSNTQARGGGGAGGSYVRKTINVTPGQVINYTIGAGGVASTAGFTNLSVGGSGGVSTVSAASTVVASAQGGAGGQNISVTNQIIGGTGGLAPQSANVGDISYYGGNGATADSTGTGGGGGSAGSQGNGSNAGNTTARTVGGAAGNAGGAVGANGHNDTLAGVTGGNPGAGGSGGGVRNPSPFNSNGQTRVGGAGGNGMIIFAYNEVSNPDSDSDGLPDAWEIQFFGNISQNDSGDKDLDGVSNINEYLAGTHPDSSQSSFRVGTITYNGQLSRVSLSWQSVIGRSYRVMASTTLLSNSWQAVSSDLAGTGGTLSFEEVESVNTAKFYRVEVRIP
jgi:uncharacterized repeat protein (TIGR02543 family)